TRYVPPRTPVEQTLARILSEVLRVERVGIEDNFFELGGDSILSIQIVARAGRAGLKLKPHQLFKHPKIVELAAVAGTAGEAQFDSGPVAGEAALTPIQEWFFEQNLQESQHYNQAFLLEVVEPLDRLWLERALRELERHHDALRFRYARAPGGWRQFYSGPGEPAPLTWTSIAGLPESEQRNAMEAAAAAAQASLNLESGPLWCAVYFDLGAGRSASAAATLLPSDAEKDGLRVAGRWTKCGAGVPPAGFGSVPPPEAEELPDQTPGQLAGEDAGATMSTALLRVPGRLLIVLHHLAVDGVSWRALIEDLETAY